MPSRNSQRLELTWFNKDKALIPSERGRYGYEWVDPRDPRYCEVHTLVEMGRVEGIRQEEVEGKTYSALSRLEPTVDNLLVLGESGDLLEALRHVPELSEEYVGQVKCVYLDPPFNTEQAFDNYDDNLEHSVWLTMMRDRMNHIRELLSNDGSIWVHLDDVESHRMRVLMDELFGASNFIAEVAWRTTYSPENRSIFTQSHDMIMIYAKSKTAFKSARNLLPRSAAQDAAYVNPDNDPRGPWKPGDFTAQGGRGTATQFYTLTTPAGNRFDPPPGRCWLYTEARYEELLADNRVVFGVDGNGRPSVKKFLSEVMDGRVPDSWWDYSSVGHSQTAKKEVSKLFPNESPFATPKPEKLIERILQISTNPGDIVLDAFGGSGTTAAVAQKMGRRWVTCELRSDNFDSFTLPRLTKVVRGEDPGGITRVDGERIDATEGGLPDDLGPDEAFELVQAVGKISDHVSARLDVLKVVNRIIRDEANAESLNLDGAEAKELRRLLRKLTASGDAHPDVLPDVATSVRRQLKTKKGPEIVNWRGGGGFRVMELSPPVFEFDPDLHLVLLTDDAQGETLVASIAANLGFIKTPDELPFHGRKGQMRLVVVEGSVTKQTVDDVLAHLPVDERVTIAALSVPDGIRKYLRDRSRGSVIKHVPDDLFPFSGDSSTSKIED
ncbi:site-specific DNA-methyltransferase [Dietzia maris]|uniref:site-specific DNA-methyltransferase n=1 Tax=Dietzia maris TaxID=37915 RepID=UPI00344E8A4D